MEGFPTKQSQHLGARVLQISVVLPSVNICTPTGAQNQRKETALSRRVMAFVSQSNPQDRKKLGKLRQKIMSGMRNHQFLLRKQQCLGNDNKKLVRSAGCSVCLQSGGTSYGCPHQPPKMKKRMSGDAPKP